MIAAISKTVIWAIALTVTACTVGVLVGGLILRRRKINVPTKHQPSELQLNSGDGQYVVAYTLKPSLQAQPDILNPPLGKKMYNFIADGCL